MTPAEAEWAARVLGQKRTLPFAVGSLSSSASVRPPAERAAVSGIVRLLAGQTSLWLGCSDWEELLRSCDVLQGVVLTSLPAEIAAAVVETALAPVLDALSQATGTPWSVLEVSSGQQPPHSWKLALDLARNDAASLVGHVAVADADLGVLEELIRRWPLETTSLASALPLVAGVEIGMTSLTLEELKSLRVRDVLLMDVTAYNPDRHAVIRISSTLAWRVTIVGEQVTLVEPRVSAARPSTPPSGPTVPVLFQAGDVVIPLESLPTLTAGQTFQVDKAQPIRLCVDGKCIASGELVELGDRLGVRLLQKEWTGSN